MRGDLNSDILSFQEVGTGCEYTDAGVERMLSVEVTSFGNMGA